MNKHDMTPAVHDLPQLYQRPGSDQLLHALSLLSTTPSTFNADVTPTPTVTAQRRVDESGVPRYLIAVVSSSLDWIADEDCREQVWNAASLRLSERAGRSGMPSMTRDFITGDQLTVTLHEPSMTEDNLGLKTWTSSLLLSRQLVGLREYLPKTMSRVLELGAGTGLVGISAAWLWQVDVVLTDLPEIVPNLDVNLGLNAELIEGSGGSVTARALDWSDTSALPTDDAEKFEVIVAADPIYSPEHPRMLVDTVARWLKWVGASRFVVELPLRDHYEAERSDLRRLLGAASLELVVEGTEIGYDDWQTQDGSRAEVECWWSVWKPSL